MTAEAVRAYLEAQGWRVAYDGPDGWNVAHLLPSLISYHHGCLIPFVASYQANLFHGPLPSTPVDLAALLRCLGAPVVERRKRDHPYLTTIPCKLCGWVPNEDGVRHKETCTGRAIASSREWRILMDRRMNREGK